MKIKNQKQHGKKYPHQLPVSLTTTADFGFVQPCYFRECAAQDTVNLRQASYTLLQPVAKPTFGRCFLKQYSMFVPFEEIWHPWGSFLAKKPYAGAINSYVPTIVPKLNLSYLSWFTYLCSDVYAFEGTIRDYSGAGNNFAQYAGDLSILSDADLQSFNPIEYLINFLTTQSGIQPQIIEEMYQRADGAHLFTFNKLGLSEFPGFEFFDWFFIAPGDYEEPVEGYSGSGYIIAGRYTDRGRNLKKILVGTGYQVGDLEQDKSILPIVAYYKAYFDLFQPQREITWKDTHCYSFMEYLEQSGSSLESVLTFKQGKYSDFYNFIFFDLPTCYYTQNVDYAAAHINGTGINAADQPLPTSVPGDFNGDSVTEAPQNSQPHLELVDSRIYQNQLDILKRLYQRINISTALGGKIREYLRIVFGSDYKQDDESNYIGANTVNIDITQVMSFAETSEGYLGEYAGKGVGYDPDGRNLSYTCRSAGYVLSLFAIVPDARLCQNLDPMLNHITRHDFFDPSFDAISLVPTKKSNIFFQPFGYLKRLASDYEKGFGNIPNYSEYKVSFDRLNGDLVNLSTRNNLLPFSFAKYITPVRFNKRQNPNNPGITEYIVHYLNSNLIVNGLIWRYIGLQRWIGDFDRIFVNEGFKGDFWDDAAVVAENSLDDIRYRIDDNFIVHFYNDVKVLSYAKPMSESFETYTFGDSVVTEKQ